MSEKNSTQIVISSALATTITAVFTNPLEIIKVRMQNTAKGCTVASQTQCIGHTNTTYTLTNPLKKVSLFRLITTPNIMDQYKVFCDCLPFRSSTKSLVYLIRKEGFLTLTNGLSQGIVMALVSATTYLYCYEHLKKYIKQYTNHHIALPLLSALAGRTIATSLIFPFEYWKTLQQSVVGVNKQSGFKLGNKISTGFGSLLQRNLVFSGLYWVLVENIRRITKSFLQQNEEGYMDKKNLLISNMIAGSLSGAIVSSVTTPLDIVKTRRQLHPADYKNRLNIGIMKDIYTQEGPGALFTGMRQRVTKVTISCVSMLTLYEFFSDLLKATDK